MSINDTIFLKQGKSVHILAAPVLLDHEEDTILHSSLIFLLRI